MAASTLPLCSETRTMLDHNNELTTALSTNPLATLGLLLDKEFIQSEVQDKLMADKTREKKAVILVEAVSQEIERSPDKFEVFLQILSELRWTKEVGERMRSSYISYKNSLALVPYEPSSLSSSDDVQEPREDQKVCNTQGELNHSSQYGCESDADKIVQISTKPIKITNPDHLFNDLAVKISTKYLEIGTDLGLKYEVLWNELETGEFKMRPGSQKAQKMLHMWKQSTSEDKFTYSALGTALEKNGFQRYASKHCYSTEQVCEESTPSFEYQDNSVEVKVKLDDFQHRYRKLRDCARSELLERSMDTLDFLYALTDLPIKVKNQYRHAIDNNLSSSSYPQCVRMLFLNLNLQLSFIDYGLLESIIQQFCTYELKEDMRSYSLDMEKFKGETTIAQLIGHLPGQPQDDPKYCSLVAKLGLNASKCTLKKVDDIRFKYCSEMKFSKIVFHLLAIIASNSFIVKWLVSYILVPDLVTSSRSIEVSFFKENAITSLSLNKVLLYDETTSTILAQFNSLHQQTVLEVNESKRSVEELALCLAEKLVEIDSIHLIELILKTSLLSFTDFEILNFIVHEFGSEKLKEKMQTYSDSITMCAKQITVQKMIDLMPERRDYPEKFKIMECTIKSEPSHYTLEDVLNLQTEILYNETFKNLTFLSLKVENQNTNSNCSFSISWLIPSHQSSRLLSLPQVDCDLFQREKIISLFINNKLLYPKIFQIQFTTELKKQYQQLQVSKPAIEWLSSPPHKLFRLVMVHGKSLQPEAMKDELIQMSISSRVDDIMHVKIPVKLENIFRSKRLKSEVILIEGSPNSGRTSLTTHIIQKWAQGELFEEFTLVIFVQLGDPAVQRAKSISDLLPCQDRELAQKVAAEVEATNGRGVLWILDGWDELPPHLQEDSILHKLLPPKPNREYEKRLLPDSLVIVTSRPISSGYLHSVVSSRVEIIGLNPEEKRQYFSDCLKGDTKALELLLEKTEDNLVMQSSSYLPLNTALIVHFFKCNNHSLPHNECDLFTAVIISCIQHHLQKEGKEHTLPKKLKSLSELLSVEIISDLFRDLCKLAYHGMMKTQVTFSSSELPQGSNTLGLLCEIKSFLKDGKSVFYTFNHHSIQEMLAALHIALSLPVTEQVSLFQQFFHQPYCVGVFRFYSAITKLESPGMDKAILETFSKSSKPQVNLLRCLHEAQNPFLCQLLANSLTYFSKSLSPLDCLSIGYFVSMSTNDKILTLQLSNNHIGDHGVKHLTKYLCDSSSPYSLAHEADAKHLCGWRFHLFNQSIQADGAVCIAKVLQTSHVMNSLELWNSEIGGKGLQYICQALITNTSLIELNLSSCNLVISYENGPIVREMLQKNKSLKTLNVSGKQNNMSDTGLFYISEGLKENTSLTTLAISNISEDSGKALATAIATNSALALVELNLNNIEITKESGPIFEDMLQRSNSLREISFSLKYSSNIGVLFIVESLHKLRTLTIRHNHITSVEAKYLSKMLIVNQSLTSLNISPIVDEGVAHLAEALHKNDTLRTLNISFSHFTSVGAKCLSKMLIVNRSLTSLDISYNSIGDEGVAHLAEALKKNETLDDLNIGSCDITDVGVASLTDVLRINSSLLNLWLFDNHALTEKGVRPLLDTCYRKSMRQVQVVLPRHLSLFEEKYKQERLSTTSLDFPLQHTKKSKYQSVETGKSEFGPKSRVPISSSTGYMKTSTESTYYQKTKIVPPWPPEVGTEAEHEITSSESIV